MKNNDHSSIIAKTVPASVALPFKLNLNRENDDAARLPQDFLHFRIIFRNKNNSP